MVIKMLPIAGAVLIASLAAVAQDTWDSWPPRDYLVKSLVEAVPRYLDEYHPDTGRFGTEPWICSDQNRIFPLAAAWAIEDQNNPWHHSDEVLEAVAKGGEALAGDMDADGKWTFRKKDNSTWGQIHMPWTYSQWIRAYHLVRDALPEASRKKWEQGLLLGFKGIRRYADGGVHNIPTHHAMALYIAGVCFDNDDWRNAATTFMAKAVDKQDPVGFWSENFGPVVGYNRVYVDALGIYYHFSKDPVVLDALERSAKFHSSVLWPDGSSVSCIDERQVYHKGIGVGNVGFSRTPEGRGFLLKQVAAYRKGGEQLVNADYAAAMLLYGGQGEGIPPAAERDESAVALGDNDALIRRKKPWQWAFSGYACKPADSRWIQDRQNLVDVYHDALGLVIGGGNTKLQPYWSTFTVGDPALLEHEAGDESPDFTPDIDLLWTPDSATISNDEATSIMTLKYGDVECQVTAQALEDGTMTLTYEAPQGRRVEAHVPLLRRAEELRTGAGEAIRLNEEDVLLSSIQVGGHVVLEGLKISVPEGAWLRWPAWQHNPYKKDGSSSISTAKLALVLPFDAVDEYTIGLSYGPEKQFDGLAFSAIGLPCVHTEGTYTKTLHDLGSQFLGNTKPGDSITFTLPEVEPGRYQLLGDFVKAYSYGIIKVLVNGKQVGDPFDAYCEGVDAAGECVSFGEVELRDGEHKIAIEVVGKNEEAESSFISVKRWLLRPLGG